MSKEIRFLHHNNSLCGGISAKLPSDLRLDDFCVKHIPSYNPDRLEAIAIRLFAGKENIITIYALDKSHQENSSENDSLPVKKFKIEGLTPEDILHFFTEYNFTLSTGNYDIDSMTVINK